MLDDELRITRIRHDFIFCIDPGFWIQEVDRKKRLTFGQSSNSEQIAKMLKGDHRVRAVDWARSLFEDARRRDHATLTTINFDDIAPANVRLVESFDERVGIFEVSLAEIRIARDGPIAFPFSARYAPGYERNSMPIAQTLRELAVLRESTHRLFRAAARYVFDIIASTELFGKSDPGLFEKSLGRTHRFEIVDFDVGLANGSELSLESVLSDSASSLARELVGFIRASRPEVWPAYRESFVRDFFSRNLGNRGDELWIFNGKCLFRHHPEEKERADVQLWFEDARLALTILLQKGTALEYLYWVMKNDLNKINTRLANSHQKYDVDVTELLGVVEGLANKLFDPLVVERHIAHEFFRKLLNRAVEVFEIEELSKLCRDRMRDVRTIVQAVAAQIVSSSTLRSNLATEQLTRLMAWLSVLVIILAIAQIVVGVITLIK